MGRVIVVTGTPGTGKTTFSTRLARELRAHYIPLTEYVSKHRLYDGIDRKRKSKVIDIARTRASLSKLLSGTKGLVVVDTHIPDGILPRRTVQKVFVLRCHPRVLESRLAGKKWNREKIRENVLAELLDSCLTAAVKYYGRQKVVQLDTSHTSLRRCMTSARKALLSKSLKGKSAADWFTKLEKDGHLGRYLKQ
jgi:adenylate kinase